MRGLALALLAAAAAGAQPIRVYSEFQRIDPFGNVVAADKAAHPREILSPAIVRHANTSFHVAVEVPKGQQAFLHVQQNPDRTLDYQVYREVFTKTANGWIPDALTPVSLPYTIVLPEAQNPIPGQTTAVFLLDLWAKADTPAQRMRFEVLLNSGDLWIVYPMEVRVRAAAVPRIDRRPGTVPPVSAGIELAARDAWCGAHLSPGAPFTVRQVVRRNALQDAALARQANFDLLQHAGKDWCRTAVRPPGDFGAEWYLRARDALFRLLP